MRIAELGRRRQRIQIGTEDLLSHYPLNETSGQALDIIGNQHADVFGSVVRNGEYYTFDGSTAFLEVPTTGSVHGFVDANGNELPFSLRISIYFNNMNQCWFFSRREGSSTGEWQWTIDSAGYLSFTLFQQTLTTQPMTRRTNFQLTTNKWYRLAVTYDASKLATGIKMYANGVQVDSVTEGLSSYTGMQSTVAETIFARPQFNNGYKFAGSIADVRMDKGTAFSADEIRADYNYNF